MVTGGAAELSGRVVNLIKISIIYLVGPAPLSVKQKQQQQQHNKFSIIEKTKNT